MFKRRNARPWSVWIADQIYPRGGFMRAGRYLWHRMRRLPDPPHRIARGVFAGTLANFPPIFGGQMLVAAGLAYILRGNILAALLATLLSNPLTTPLIALVSLKLGHRMLGTTETFDLTRIFAAFSGAGADLWHNTRAAFGPEQASWGGLIRFWHDIYWPYLLGSILPGLVVSLVLYWLTVPTLTAYQALRRRRLLAIAQKRRADKA